MVTLTREFWDFCPALDVGPFWPYYDCRCFTGRRKTQRIGQTETDECVWMTHARCFRWFRVNRVRANVDDILNTSVFLTSDVCVSVQWWRTDPREMRTWVLFYYHWHNIIDFEVHFSFGFLVIFMFLSYLYFLFLNMSILFLLILCFI